MDLRALRLVVDIVEQGGFSAAAKANYITQPALSRKVAELEKSCGFKLFDRDMRPVGLTAEGAALYDRIVDLIRRDDALEEEVSRIRDGKGMALRLNHCSAGMVSVFDKGLRDFSRRYPEAKVLVERAYVPDALRNVADGSVDAAIINKPEGDGMPGLEHGRIAACGLVAVVPRRHSLSCKPCLDLADVEGYDLVTVTRGGWPGVVGAIEALCREAGFEVVFSHHTPPIELPLFVSLNGEIGLVPDKMVPDNDGVVSIPVAGTAGFDVELIWRSGDDRPAVTALRQAFDIETP